MATYALDRPWIVRDFPGAPNTALRVPDLLLHPPQLAGMGADPRSPFGIGGCCGQRDGGGAMMMGNYTVNCPPANLNPPKISTLLLPSSTAVSNPAPSGDGIGLFGLLAIGAVAFFALGGMTKQNPRRNIAMGFWAGRGANRKFHPIRASHDYDPARTGERRRRSKPARRRRRR